MHDLHFIRTDHLNRGFMISHQDGIPKRIVLLEIGKFFRKVGKNERAEVGEYYNPELNKLSGAITIIFTSSGVRCLNAM